MGGGRWVVHVEREEFQRVVERESRNNGKLAR